MSEGFMSIAGNLLASDVAAAGLIAGVLAFVACIFVVVLLIAVGLLFLIYKAAKTVPQDHRQIDPPMVWLMLIPLFNVYWAFVALPAVSRGLRAARTAVGSQDQSDCGLGAANFVCIVNVINFIFSVAVWLSQVGKSGDQSSALTAVQGLVGLVLMVFYIIYVVKVHTSAKALLAESNG
jgi:hypothetical protein